MRASLRLVLVAWLVLAALPAFAQYAEIPRPLPAGAVAVIGSSLAEQIRSATQIGRRLFIGGRFTQLGTATGGAAVVNPLGVVQPQAFPLFGGNVSQIVVDNAGGWFVAGAFTSVAGRAIRGFARVRPDRTIDERFQIVADGAIRLVAVAHGRVYLVGDFQHVNNVTRRGLAALDAATGELTAWGAGFDPRGRTLSVLSASSLGVYVSGLLTASTPGSRIWGFDAQTGRVLFERAGWATAMAASSARVYVGGFGYERPVWAIDPLTGEDAPWQIGLQFVIQSGTYGDYTSIGAMLLDGGRLYFGGRFGTTTGVFNLTAVDAATGDPASWRPPPAQSPSSLVRIGPVIVATLSSGPPLVLDPGNGGQQNFAPAVNGAVATVAPAPEGAVLGGEFTGTGGVPRAGLASINLDTYEIEPWTSALAFSPPDTPVNGLATDGTWLFARVEGRFGGADVRLAKIDPVTGAVVAERTWPGNYGQMRVVGGEIVIARTGFDAAANAVGIVTIADWSYRELPLTFTGGGATSLDVDGNTIYLSGDFSAINGQSRVRLAAVDRVTGALHPWRPTADERPIVRAASGRVWIAGAFTKVSGQRRRGLAEIDAVSGAVLPWHPDAPGVSSGEYFTPGVNALEIGPDGNLYAALGPFPFYVFYDQSSRPTVGGQATAFTVAFSLATGRRLPWRPSATGMVAVLPGCLLTDGGCLPPARGVPTGVQVTQAAGTTVSWTLPPSPARTAVRFEVSPREGLPAFYSVDLPPNQTSISGPALPGSVVARVRAIDGLVASMASPDVSFGAGPAGALGAPLNATVVADGPRVTFAWQPPSTGAPQQYVLEAGTGEGLGNLGSLALAGTATSVTIDGPVGRYFARVIAVNGGARSTPGQELLVDVRVRSGCNAVPPTNLTASVVGRVVTLSWTPSPDASDAPPTIAVGTVPGATDVGLFEPPAFVTSFSTPAPPGTYYVRLTAGCLAQNSSNEVVVVVP